MIVITGATGNTGKPLALSLLSAGEKVRVISRNPERAKDLVEKGAELIVTDLRDTDALEHAFSGARIVYAVIPPDPRALDMYAYQKSQADSIINALKYAKVMNVVMLSSVGAQMETGSGVVMGLRYMEQKLNSMEKINCLYLRCTYFMENLYGSIDMIKQAGFLGSPIRGDISMPMIATKDIAAYAFKRIQALDFPGKNHQYLLGHKDVTMNEVARIIGKEIGKPNLKYDNIAPDVFLHTMREYGMSESVSNLMIEFMHSVNNGKIFTHIHRDKENTTPTTIEEFAKQFAMVYQGK